MSQRTQVLRLDAPAAERLEGRLASGPFEFREVPHARFSAKGEGHVLTLYTSGKLVIQGPEPEALGLALGIEAAGGAGAADGKSRSGGHDAGRPRSTPGRAGAVDGQSSGELTGEPTAESRDAPPSAVTYPSVGSDEAGKGDFLGPLVVCALRLDSDSAERLAGGGVVDSKRLGDARALELGAALRQHFQPAVVRLDPLEYNAAYARHGNLNLLLAELHGEAIREAAREGDRVVVDQFGGAQLMLDALRGVDVRLEQRPRAEEELCVAAASIVARAEFLIGLGELGQRFGIALAKGGGAPADAAAREFCAAFGRERLGEVAKMHFKNAGRVR